MLSLHLCRVCVPNPIPLSSLCLVLHLLSCSLSFHKPLLLMMPSPVPSIWQHRKLWWLSGTGNIIRPVLYWQRATFSMGTVNKSISYSLVGPRVCLFMFFRLNDLSLCLCMFCLEADRISFSFYFSAPENAFFIFLRFIFRLKKTSAFSFLFFFRY